MKPHADSQIDDTEAGRLMAATLASPAHAATRRLVRARRLDSVSMVGQWAMETPEGPLHEIIECVVLTGEMSQSFAYREQFDADAVWAHLLASE